MLSLGMAQRPAPPLALTPEDKAALEKIAASPSLPHRTVREAKGLLMASEGIANERTAQALGVSRSTVLSWRRQFPTDGVMWVGKVHKGRGRKPTIPQAKVDQIVHDTLHTAPPDATQWSVRSMARHAGICKSTVQEIWSSRGIKPHRVETFKLSNDPKFEEKLTDVVQLYMGPPVGSVVLAVDEKSQVQALERTQPSLPMKPGRAGTMTHDYRRHGTTTLFAALNILTGVVLGSCMPRHRNFEFLAFLKTIDKAIDKALDVHIIADNHGTHKHPNVVAWLAKHPRFHMHFVPTSSSWLNLVERWFRDLTDKRLRRGSFTSVAQLIGAIEGYIDHNNQDPKPYKWTKTAAEIIEKVRRGRVALEQARVV